MFFCSLLSVFSMILRDAELSNLIVISWNFSGSSHMWRSTGCMYVIRLSTCTYVVEERFLRFSLKSSMGCTFIFITKNWGIMSPLL